MLLTFWAICAINVSQADSGVKFAETKNKKKGEFCVWQKKAT
jgi:hypothetical protein